MSNQLVVCCSPGQMLSPGDAEALARGFKAMADPIRLRLLSLIASAPGGEVCVCELTPRFDVAGPTVSHHLKVLREAGLITGERRGTWIYYRPVVEAFEHIAAAIGSMPAAAGQHDLRAGVVART